MSLINGLGAVATFIVTLIVGITKFTKGAWVPIVVVPLVVLLLKSISRHYRVGAGRSGSNPTNWLRTPSEHTFVVLVGTVHRGVAEAMQYARSLRPHHIVALHIADEDVDHAEVERDWATLQLRHPARNRRLAVPRAHLARQPLPGPTRSTMDQRPAHRGDPGVRGRPAKRHESFSTAKAAWRSSCRCWVGRTRRCFLCRSTWGHPRPTDTARTGPRQELAGRLALLHLMNSTACAARRVSRRWQGRWNASPLSRSDGR